MPRNLHSCVIRALDEFSYLVIYKEMIEIALEQFDNADEKTPERVQMLLENYRAHLDHRLNELGVQLNQIRELVGATPSTKGG